MICCHRIENLQTPLAEISQLVAAYQRGELSFADDTVKWLDDTEKRLAQLRIPGSSEIATLKGRILKTADAMSQGAEKPARSQLRAARNVAAAEALERVEEIMRHALQEAEERLERFEEKLCEGMTAFCLQVELPEKYKPHSTWLQEIWDMIAANGPTRPLALYLASSLSLADRLFLLNTIITRINDYTVLDLRENGHGQAAQ